MDALTYVVIAALLLIGLFVGYQWGYDIGYSDRINDDVGAQLRRRINRDSR
jgi:hypothetical protein